MTSDYWEEGSVPKDEIVLVKEGLASLINPSEGNYFFSLTINGTVYAFDDNEANRFIVSVQGVWDVLVKERSKGAN